MNINDNEIKLQRYGVGNCGMLPSKDGRYVEVSDVLALLNYIIDDDSLDVLLSKVQTVVTVLS